MAQIRLEIDGQRADYERAQGVHLRRLRRRRDPMKWFWYAVAAGAPVGLIMLADGGARSVTWLAPTLLMAYSIVVPSVATWLNMTFRERQWQDVDHLLQPTVWEFTADAVRLTSPLWDICYRWEMFRARAEDGSLFLLYTTPEQYRVVPKRVFANVAQQQEFREMLRQKVGKGAGGFPVMGVGESTGS